MYIQLNTPSLSDGVLKVWAGPSATPIVDMDNLVLRNENAPLRYVLQINLSDIESKLSFVQTILLDLLWGIDG